MARLIASRAQDLCVQLQNSINPVEPVQTQGGVSLDAVKRLILRSQQARQAPPDAKANSINRIAIIDLKNINSL